MQKQVLIFGGSFNPPTRAHETIIRACLELTQFDEVWVMPSGNRADKQIPLSSKHRLAMLQLVREHSFANSPRLHVTDVELHLPRPTRLFRTLTALRKKYPDVTFWFAMGNDSYESLSTWYRADELPALWGGIVVFAEKPVPSNHSLIWLGADPAVHTISSTKVRAAVAAGKHPRDWVSPAVWAYIKMHHLYSGASYS